MINELVFFVIEHISEKDKRKLQNKMAYGIDDIDAMPKEKAVASSDDQIYESLDEFDEG